MDKYTYLVGWCPECKSITIVRAIDLAACGCGNELLSLTACKDAGDVARAIPLIIDIMNAAVRSYDYRKGGDADLNSEAEAARWAFKALSEEHTGDENEVFDTVDDKKDSACEEETSDESGHEDLYRFMVAVSPFPVYVRAADSREANETLHEHLMQYALAGFEAALEDDEAALTVMPLDGNYTYYHFPDWVLNQ